ncbi:MAG: hypothetical protein Q9209_003137 [Squamulea sp. 1 TL-2023]
MDPIPGSALGRHSLVNGEGYIVGTSIHALTALHRREAASTSGNTCNPANFSILGKRKDDDDDVESSIDASKAQNQREDRAAKRPRRQTLDQYLPSAYGFDPHSPPFDWFTQTGNQPLDIDSDIVWILEQGRYHGYRLSTAEQEPLADPQLVTPETVDRAITRAKKELGHQKRRFTGNPKTRWNTQLPSASAPKPSTIATVQDPMSKLTPIGTAQPPMSSFISSSGIGSGLQPHVNQGVQFPPARLRAMADNASYNSGRSIKGFHGIAPIVVEPSDTSKLRDAPAITISAPGANTHPSDIQHKAADADSTRSVGSQVIAPDPMKAFTIPSKQSMANGLTAGSNQLQRGPSKATKTTSHLHHKESRLLDYHTNKHVNQHDRVESVTSNTNTPIGGKKRGPTTEVVDGSRPKRVRLSVEAPAGFPKSSNDPKHKQPYTYEDHIIDYLTPWQKRKPAGGHINVVKQKENHARKTISASSPMPPTVRSGGPARRNTKKASMSSLVDPPVDHIRIYSVEAREKAKSDPILKMQIEEADRRTQELPQAPEEPHTNASLIHNGMMHHNVPKSLRAPPPMSGEWNIPPAQELPVTMLAYEELAHMNQKQNFSEKSAYQHTQINQRFESKLLEKPHRSSSGLTPLATSAVKGKNVLQPGVMPVTVSSSSHANSLARSKSSEKPATKQSDEIPAVASTPPSSSRPTVEIQQNTNPYFTAPKRTQTAASLTVDDTIPNPLDFSNIDSSLRNPASFYQWAPSDADDHGIVGADYVADPYFLWQPLPLE